MNTSITPVDLDTSPWMSRTKKRTDSPAAFVLARSGHAIAIGPKDEPVDDDDMDPREDDPDKLHGPHRERHEADMRAVRRVR